MKKYFFKPRFNVFDIIAVIVLGASYSITFWFATLIIPAVLWSTHMEKEFRKD
jgi:hypothetical protein